MSAGEQRRKRKQPAAPPVGRVRCADGTERDVYEDAGGRQYVLGAQGEKVFGLWPDVLSTRPPVPTEEPTPPADDSGPPPPSDEPRDDAPWQRAGGARLDCEAHRGRMLSLLGMVSFSMGIIAICCGVTGVIGVGLGLYVRSAASRDLAKMSTGEMDPEGEQLTRAALQDAWIATLLSGVGLLLWFLLTLVMIFLIF
jgi:hypothetical protein